MTRVLRHMEHRERTRLLELRQMLNEPTLVDVDVLRGGDRVWWRLSLGCDCYWTGAKLPGCEHPAMTRDVPASDLRKPQRLRRRVGRWVSDADAQRVVAALYTFVESKESSS